MKRTLLLLTLLTALWAQSNFQYPPLYLVSIPTAGTLPKGSYTLELLLQNNGGILPKLGVGLTDHFTIGMSFGVQRFIGEERTEVSKPTPEVQVKYRIFDETESYPALVIGLDTQGRGDYNDEKGLNRYDQKAWGVYLVSSKNWNLLGDFGLHLGISKNTWENDDNDEDLDIFFGLDKALNRDFALMVEYDVALNDDQDTTNDLGDITFGKGQGYLNAGLRWVVAPNLMLELNVNNVTLNHDRADYSNREVKIMYSASF